MTISEPPCRHTRLVRVKRERGFDSGTLPLSHQDYEEDLCPVWEWEEVSTLEDIDTGRMKCSSCGKIEYYTGQWRDFWEKGKSCLGSDKFNREEEVR